jgi:hypothetical protein
MTMIRVFRIVLVCSGRKLLRDLMAMTLCLVLYCENYNSCFDHEDHILWLV